MNSLVEWYNKNKRDLPWRETLDPYYIWLSEIILQQTRVNQGLAYYIRFINKYPTIESLANSSSDEVFKLWQGLGYYSRARNLLLAAKQIVDEFGGKFPESFNDLMKLKGVGEYTAAAIASICFNIPVPVVDGNVYRVLSRIYAISDPINTVKSKKLFYELAKEIFDIKLPGTHNQAIMELGALICTPKNPQCTICPINKKCVAFGNNNMEKYPVKAKKSEKKTRYFYYYIFTDSRSFLIHKRDQSDIWQNLYEFPLFESPNRLTDEELLNNSLISGYINTDKVQIVKISGEIKHILTHQVIYAKFIQVKFDDVKIVRPNGFIKVSASEIQNYAMPRLITRYLGGDKTGLLI